VKTRDKNLITVFVQHLSDKVTRCSTFLKTAAIFVITNDCQHVALAGA